MQVIPVIDLKDGYVVHARKGERDRYQKVQSVLINSAEPLAVLKAFRDKLGCSQFYIADLDAIQRKGNHDPILSSMVRQIPGIEIMVDAGVDTPEAARRILNLGVQRVVIGSETLSGLSILTSILEDLSSDRVIFSIDLKQGKVLSESEELRDKDPDFLIRRVKPLGVKKFILLELAKVGTESGIVGEPIRDILRNHRDATLFIGGGVRSTEDLISLKALGVEGVLIATAFHNGKITRRDLENI
jgi:phosphoribosylformimino-5-aminoimidazole carboxamide ribotide isomerase